jgi:hypothetical protein
MISAKAFLPHMLGHARRCAASWFGLLGVFAVLAVAGPQAQADTATVDGQTWTYSVGSDGKAIVTAGPKSGDVTIPSELGGHTVTIIADVFYNCSGLTSVTIPVTVASIWAGAFYNCSGLTSVTIPSSVTSIGNRVFKGCKSLTSVTIPTSVKSIGFDTFSNCTGLQSVKIGDSVTDIGGSAFEGCKSLT